MKFQKKTEKELEQGWLLPEGPYWATVIEAEDQVSKKGNEMIKLKLNVATNGQNYHVYDFISGSFMEFKLRHFCESAGKLDIYEKGEFSAEDVLRWRVIAWLFVDKQEGYSDKNSVRDYMTADECEGPIGGDGAEPIKVVEVESTSDLPF